jgi:hypothetical protein
VISVHCSGHAGPEAFDAQSPVDIVAFNFLTLKIATMFEIGLASTGVVKTTSLLSAHFRVEILPQMQLLTLYVNTALKVR